MEESSKQSGQGRGGRGLRAGLQVKSALGLAVVVLCLSAAGGWFYFKTASDCVRSSDRLHAVRLASALSLTAMDDLQNRNYVVLQRLVNDLIHNDSVSNVALLDSDGHIVASAGRNDPTGAWKNLMSLPPSVADIRQHDGDILTLAKPICAKSPGSSQVIGSVRMVLDTSATRLALDKVQQNLMLIAMVVAAGWLILGSLLVWRVIIFPLRRLARAARRLGEGDYSSRAGLKENDEIGDLSAAFDTMADQLAGQREQLLQAKEQLENKITQRTAQLQVTNHRLRQEMAEKEDFLRAVSHDLGAPLRNIGGMAAMAVMKYGTQLPEEVRLRLERIQANVEVESALIGELLELSRVSRRPQRRQMVDIGALIADLKGVLEFELRQKAIELTVAPHLPTLFIEKGRMRQVFQNLIDNAIKYMDKPAGGRIEISYTRAGGMHRFSVADNGPGVGPEERQKIFYVFRRSQDSRTAKVPGKGVGLALVKAVAATYDGRTYVEPRPGGGAIFCVEFAESCTTQPLESTDGIKPDYNLTGR